QAQGPSSTGGSPSPEVTGTFCRVPSPQVTRAPEASRLAYVCPFTVRSPRTLPTEAFLGSLLQQTPGPPKGPVALPSRLPEAFDLLGTPTRFDRDFHPPALPSRLRPP